MLTVLKPSAPAWFPGKTVATPGQMKVPDQSHNPPDAVSILLSSLFAPGTAGRSVQLKWTLMTRRGRPLLLLPRSLRGACQAMELYAAQRPLARIVRSVLPFVSQLLPGRLLPRVGIQSNTTSELLPFLSREAGVVPEHLLPPAILWGNQTADRQRFVVLVFNAQTRPVAVVKCGLTVEARRIIEQEAAVLAALPEGLPGGLALHHRLVTPTLSAFSAPYCPGQHPRNTDGLAEVLSAWLRPDETVPLQSLSGWETFAVTCREEKLFQALHQTMGRHLVRPAIHHGDFAPWNIRVNAGGDWTAVDWERGDLRGIPGWDWFHYVIQTAVLVERIQGAELVARIEAVLRSASFQNYARTANIADICQPLLLAYLLHQNQIVKPGEGRDVSLTLQRQLAAQWGIAL